MPEFDSNGVTINYIDEGHGPPVVLVHGFASSLHGNWRAPGIIDALVNAGRRTVALDCRGHGRSGKPHDPDAYAGAAMPGDVIALMDHLGIPKADLVGYSMGGMISSRLMASHPDRFNSVVLAGVGDAIVSRNTAAWGQRATAIASALESPDGARAEDLTARGFRIFAERSGNDLAALAAMQKSRALRGYDPAKLSETKLPVMVLIGEADTLVGSGEQLTAAIPGAKLVKVPGDHLTAVAAPELQARNPRLPRPALPGDHITLSEAKPWAKPKQSRSEAAGEAVILSEAEDPVMNCTHAARRRGRVASAASGTTCRPRPELFHVKHLC